MQKLILGVTLVMAAVFGQAVFADNDNNPGKVTVCHNGDKTVSINASGLNGHLNHGDTVGSCESRHAVVVMMQCDTTAEGDIEVVAASASPYVPADLIPEPEDDCATALADLLDTHMRVDAVTPGGDGVTNYKITGFVAVPAS